MNQHVRAFGNWMPLHFPINLLYSKFLHGSNKNNFSLSYISIYKNNSIFKNIIMDAVFEIFFHDFERGNKMNYLLTPLNNYCKISFSVCTNLNTYAHR